MISFQEIDSEFTVRNTSLGSTVGLDNPKKEIIFKAFEKAHQLRGEKVPYIMGQVSSWQEGKEFKSDKSDEAVALDVNMENLLPKDLKYRLNESTKKIKRFEKFIKIFKVASAVTVLTVSLALASSPTLLVGATILSLSGTNLLISAIAIRSLSNAWKTEYKDREEDKLLAESYEKNFPYFVEKLGVDRKGRLLKNFTSFEYCDVYNNLDSKIHSIYYNYYNMHLEMQKALDLLK